MSVQLCSVNDLKQMLRISQAETSQDAILQKQIWKASGECETACHRSFTYATYINDLYNAGGQARLALRQWPVDDEAFFQLAYLSAWTVTTYFDPGDWTVNYNNGVIALLGGLKFPLGDASTMAWFSAGYPLSNNSNDNDTKVEVPDDLSGAVCEHARHLYLKQLGVIDVQQMREQRADAVMFYSRYARLW